LDQKLKDGKIQMAVKQSEDNFTVNKKKGKKQKQANKPAGDQKTFNIDFAVINKFGLVQVSPPISPDDLDHKISELQDKQKRYDRDGKEELSKEKSEIEKNVERMVEEDIEAEVKAAEAEENSEEEEKEEKRPVKAKKGIKQPKDEFFDGSDSEEENKYTSAAYAKPSRGGGQQVNRGGRRGGRGGKQGNTAFDDDDFPTL
jgi:hypothetical protein